jgi:hypothetical protein
MNEEIRGIKRERKRQSDRETESERTSAFSNINIPVLLGEGSPVV